MTKIASILLVLITTACGSVVDVNSGDAGTTATTGKTVTIGQATCTPTDRASIGVKAAPGTMFQLFIADTEQAYDCTGEAPPCRCIGGGDFALDTYDCPTTPTPR